MTDGAEPQLALPPRRRRRHRRAGRRRTILTIAAIGVVVVGFLVLMLDLGIKFMPGITHELLKDTGQ